MKEGTLMVARNWDLVTVDIQDSFDEFSLAFLFNIHEILSDGVNYLVPA